MPLSETAFSKTALRESTVWIMPAANVFPGTWAHAEGRLVNDRQKTVNDGTIVRKRDRLTALC